MPSKMPKSSQITHVSRAWKTEAKTTKNSQTSISRTCPCLQTKIRPAYGPKGPNSISTGRVSDTQSKGTPHLRSHANGVCGRSKGKAGRGFAASQTTTPQHITQNSTNFHPFCSY